MILSKKSEQGPIFPKNLAFRTEIARKSTRPGTKTRFLENHEKCNNSSPNGPNWLIFGHKVLLGGPQKRIHGIFEILTFCPFLGHFWGSILTIILFKTRDLYETGAFYRIKNLVVSRSYELSKLGTFRQNWAKSGIYKAIYIAIWVVFWLLCIIFGHFLPENRGLGVIIAVFV